MVDRLALQTFNFRLWVREVLRYGPVSRPAHLRSELRVNRDSPAWHGRETVPQHV